MFICLEPPKTSKSEDKLTDEKAQQHENDIVLLGVIDAYCISTRTRHKVSSGEQNCLGFVGAFGCLLVAVYLALTDLSLGMVLVDLQLVSHTDESDSLLEMEKVPGCLPSFKWIRP